MNGFFDGINEFFGKLSSSDNNDNNSYSDDTCLLTIPVKSMKIGGLRLFLTLYLMGQQNTPEKGSWQAIQRTESNIDMYYKDESAYLSINFQDDNEKKNISIERVGAKPSVSYTMQESVILHGVLDELQLMASNVEIDESDRLLILNEPGDAIDKAREVLSFS